MNRPLLWFFCCLCFNLISSANTYAKDNDNSKPVVITQEKLDEGSIQLTGPFRHHLGDLENAHLPGFNDSEWELTENVWINPRELPDDWDHIRWFRFQLKPDSSMAGVPISLTHSGFGAREIYYNGRLLDQLGVVSGNSENYEIGKTRGWTVFNLDPGDEHLLAVRSAFTDYRDYTRFNVQIGVSLVINQPERSSEYYQESYKFASSVTWFIIGLALIFSVLHLFFYLFNLKHSFNLWFSLACFCFAIGTWTQGQWAFNETLASMLVFQKTFQSTMVLTFLFLAMFMRSVMKLGYPLYFKIIAACVVILAAVNLFTDGRIILIAALIISVEAFIVGIQGIYQKKKGAVFITGGVATFLGAVYFTVALEMFGYAGNFSELSAYHAPYAGFIIAMVGMSLYQSRHLAELVIENERISVELERARDLQLSLIPKELPKHSGYTISASMFTAAEVGGDYYDYIMKGNGAMVWALGDATGHGTEAGLVAAMSKTLFLTHASHLKPDDCLRKMSLGLKNTGLRQKYMCMGLLTINNGTVNWCAAGMPPAIVIRNNKTESVEILESKGMPLGSVTGFNYLAAETSLESDDFVILISDGLPEQMNDQREQFGMQRVYDVLLKNGNSSPGDVINELKSAIYAWKGNQPIQDDMSIVCLRKI